MGNEFEQILSIQSKSAALQAFFESTFIVVNQFDTINSTSTSQ
jgi:hypothetical protein